MFICMYPSLMKLYINRKNNNKLKYLGILEFLDFRFGIETIQAILDPIGSMVK